MKNLYKGIYPPFYPNINISKAEGVFLYDNQSDKKYLDFSASAGMAIVGYGNERLKQVIHEQVDKLIIAPQKYKTEEADQLSQEILSFFSNHYNVVIPTVTGSEAVETAMQIAIKYTGKNKFLSFSNAYHGRTLAAGSIGAGDYGLGFCKDKMDTIVAPQSEAEVVEVLAEVEKKFRNNEYAAFIGETIISNAGYFSLAQNFITGLANLCNKYGVLLIVDEVLTGFGRTGKLFAFEHYGIEPNMVCLAKGLSSGYTAISAVVTSSDLVRKYDCFSTFAWSPLACSIALENMRIIKEEELVLNSEKLGGFTLALLQKYLLKCPLVSLVQGQGLGIAILFDCQESTVDIYNECLLQGLIVFKNVNLNMVFIQPPLIIKQENLERGLKIFLKAVKRVYEKKSY